MSRPLKALMIAIGVAMGGAAVPAPALSASPAPSRVLHVGPGRTLATPSAAAAVARNGDRVEIDAGTYSGDVATWTQDDLTLVGVGGRAHLAAAGQSAQGKAIWVIAGARTRVANIEFSGAAVPDQNGAGIRQEGAGLTVVNCWFHHNENGILAGANADSDIVVRRSKFTHLRTGTGYTHNLYIGAVRSFTLQSSLVTGASVGHEVKSRALKTTITANLIIDKSADSSYSIDVPNGGDTLITGNVIEQGPASENSVIISYGAEGLSNPVTRLWLVNNTLVNHLDRGTFLALATTSSDVHVWDNLLVGPGDLVTGATAERVANRRVGTAGFVDAAAFDFHLRKRSAAVDQGRLAPAGHRAALEWVDGRRSRPRPSSGPLDLGAFEFVP